MKCEKKEVILLELDLDEYQKLLEVILKSTSEEKKLFLNIFGNKKLIQCEGCDSVDSKVHIDPITKRESILCDNCFNIRKEYNDNKAIKS